MKYATFRYDTVEVENELNTSFLWFQFSTSRNLGKIQQFIFDIENNILRTKNTLNPGNLPWNILDCSFFCKRNNACHLMLE